MSVLEWPTDLGVANGFATAAGKQRGTVLPHHVVFSDGATCGTDISGTVWGDISVVGVTLDHWPLQMRGNQQLWPETTPRGTPEKLQFAYAITGVVPVVVPSDKIAEAKLGDLLCVKEHNSTDSQFGKTEHVAPSLCVVKLNALVADMKKVGVIVGLGNKFANHCLVVLSYW